MKKFGFKSVFLIFLITISMFLTNNKGLIQIEKTAIISALGIDMEGGKLTVTAQIILPQATDTSENAKAVVTGTGDTIGSAITNIGSDTGWYPKLSFCKVLIINQNIVDDKLTEVINYLLYSTKIYDSVLICASKQSAKDVLSATSPLDILSSYSIEKIMLKNPGKANSVYYTRAKDLAESMLSVSKKGMIPLIDVDDNDDIGKVEPTENPPKENLKDVIFKSYTTLLLSDGKITGSLDKNQTHFYNLLHKDVSDSYFDFTYGETKVLLKINENKHKIKISANGNKVRLYLKLNLKATLVDVDENGEIKVLPTPKILPDEIIINGSDYIKNSLISLVDAMKKSKCDIFFIKQTLFEKYHSDYKKLSPDYLDRLELVVDAKVISPDKN